jgi:hypothetical protein
MLSEHAQFEDGSVSVEAGLMAMLDRMQTGAILFVLLWLAFGLFLSFSQSPHELPRLTHF